MKITKKRLTKNVAIDTAPSFSPDFVVFESDRGGNQQIYVMSSKVEAKRISFGKGR